MLIKLTVITRETTDAGSPRTLIQTIEKAQWLNPNTIMRMYQYKSKIIGCEGEITTRIEFGQGRWSGNFNVLETPEAIIELIKEAS